MAILTRVPGPALRPFVQVLWASGPASEGGRGQTGARELVLPSGKMHLALRLSERPLCVFDSMEAALPRALGTAVVGGTRAGFYVRDVSQAVPTVGAQLVPGAAGVLLGVPADELAGRHTPLDAIWGGLVEGMRAQLAETPSLEGRLACFERLLLRQLGDAAAFHPAVRAGLAQLTRRADVAAAVAASGYSHRRFAALFRSAVGLPPKLFCRVQRFERALAQLNAAPQPSWSALAAAAGYSDQAHFNRDFREFSGLTPGRYRALAPRFAHHVPVSMGDM